MFYTDTMDTFAVLLTVASPLLQRDPFVPLMTLNGFSVLELTAQAALDSGAAYVCVVANQETNSALQEAFTAQKNAQKSLVHGLKPPLTPEQGSICFAQDCKQMKTHSAPEALFVVPGDMSGIRPLTYVTLLQNWRTENTPALVPTYKGKRGYPLLLSYPYLKTPLTLFSKKELDQALSGIVWQELEVDDPGILLDAKDDEAFEKLGQYVQKTRGLSKLIVDELFARYQTPQNVQAHTSAVAEVALRMARVLNQYGYALDSELCRSGGLLHDLNRVEEDHSWVAAQNLKALGYHALASVVAAHDRELVLRPHMFTEANIVFVADKLVKETTLVSIKRRYAGALKRFPPHTAIGKGILRDKKSAHTLLKHYVEITGDAALLEGTNDFFRRTYGAT